MKKIKDMITLNLTLEEAIEFNGLVERESVVDGMPTEDDAVNRGPKCGKEFGKIDFFCSLCGQRVRFVISDTIPL